MNLFFKVLLSVIILLIFLAKAGNIYNIPLNKPYYTGEWDEPFAINAGLTALKNKWDPAFYNYGGTSVYPNAIVMYLYCKAHKISPYYAYMDKKYDRPAWPIRRKIYPVKAIYITKIIAYLLFLLGSFLYVLLFSILLLPAPFWLIPTIDCSGIFGYYSGQMLPETHVGLLAGLTTIFFIKAIITKEIKRYFMFVIICSIFASLTVAAKINAMYIMLLPLSLIWRLTKEKHINLKKVLLLFGAFIIPYILINPAVVINTKSYFKWALDMIRLSGAVSKLWMNRTSEIFSFINDLYFFNILPNWLLIILFIMTCTLLIKIDFIAFCAFMFFYLYSFQNIANMRHALHGRHFIFLILPFNLLIFFPLVYLYNKAPKYLKTCGIALCVIATLFIYPLGKTIKDIRSLHGKQFANQWLKESRDELVDFLKTSNAKIYFYDYHGFSLPNNISENMIIFSDISIIPEKLGQDEYVGFILYAESNHEKYNNDKEILLKRYSVFKVFGKPEGAYDINNEAPIDNPTIVILK